MLLIGCQLICTTTDEEQGPGAHVSFARPANHGGGERWTTARPGEEQSKTRHRKTT